MHEAIPSSVMTTGLYSDASSSTLKAVVVVYSPRNPQQATYAHAEKSPRELADVQTYLLIGV